MLDVVGIGSGAWEGAWSSPVPVITLGPMFDQGQ